MIQKLTLTFRGSPPMRLGNLLLETSRGAAAIGIGTKGDKTTRLGWTAGTMAVSYALLRYKLSGTIPPETFRFAGDESDCIEASAFNTRAAELWLKEPILSPAETFLDLSEIDRFRFTGAHAFGGDTKGKALLIKSDILPAEKLEIRDEQGLPLTTEATRDLQKRIFTQWEKEHGKRTTKNPVEAIEPSFVPQSAPLFPIDDLFEGRRLSLKRIGEFVELCRAYGSGWEEAQVHVDKGGEFLPCEELQTLLRKYPLEGRNGVKFTLHGYVDHSMSDTDPRLDLSLQRGFFSYIHAMNSELRAPDADSRRFRAWAARKWFPINKSPLWFNANCESALITSDGDLMLAKRSQRVNFYKGQWSCSFEEMMNGPSENDPGDNDLWACLKRGLFEEYRCELDRKRTRLMSVGIEGFNFTTAFLFVAYTTATRSQVIDGWITARDGKEAAALDFVKATPESVRMLQSLSGWDGRDAHCGPNGDPDDFPAGWHPVAKARMDCLEQHLAARGRD